MFPLKKAHCVKYRNSGYQPARTQTPSTSSEKGELGPTFSTAICIFKGNIFVHILSDVVSVHMTSVIWLVPSVFYILATIYTIFGRQEDNFDVFVFKRQNDII